MRKACIFVLVLAAVAAGAVLAQGQPVLRTQPMVVKPDLPRRTIAPVARPAPAAGPAPVASPAPAHELTHTLQQESRRAQSVNGALIPKQDAENNPIDNIR